MKISKWRKSGARNPKSEKARISRRPASFQEFWVSDFIFILLRLREW
jgi:hypothetical protein